MIILCYSTLLFIGNTSLMVQDLKGTWGVQSSVSLLPSLEDPALPVSCQFIQCIYKKLYAHIYTYISYAHIYVGYTHSLHLAFVI